MTSLATIFTESFAPQTRGAGRRRYLANDVLIEDGDESSLSATVASGADEQYVELAMSRDVLRAACTCWGYASVPTPCAHMWATMLAIDDEEALPPDRVARLTELVLIDYSGAELDDAWPPGQAPLALWPREEEIEAAPPDPYSWRTCLARAAGSGELESKGPGDHWSADGRILYVLDLPRSRRSASLHIVVTWQKRRKDGSWGKSRCKRMRSTDLEELRDPADRAIMSLFGGADRPSSPWVYGWDELATEYELTADTWEHYLPLLSATGRFVVSPGTDPDELLPIDWDDSAPWRLALHVARQPDGSGYRLSGSLNRDTNTMPLSEPLMVLAAGLMVTDSSVARVDCRGLFEWIAVLRERETFSIPEAEMPEFLDRLSRVAQLPSLELPDELGLESLRGVEPASVLQIEGDAFEAGRDRPRAALAFDYAGTKVAAGDARRTILDVEARTATERNFAVEAQRREWLLDRGFLARPGGRAGRGLYEFPDDSVSTVVDALVASGWRIEISGRKYRNASDVQIDVSSGIDWFSVRGHVAYDDQRVALPDLLAALEKGSPFIVLADGSTGPIPEAWLKKYGLLLSMGDVEKDEIRFRQSQVGLLDVLLESQPEASFDDTFRRVREQLTEFTGIEAVKPPDSFSGRLRGYQEEGLGWLLFLERFGFGGCLADDMGLGKTVQVLALLERRRRSEAGKLAGPSLVVAPKSLVFNWIAEARRFTPGLKVLAYAGTTRAPLRARFHNYDLVVMTYGLMRRDITKLIDTSFDYCILDEAQAIKNARSQVAKASRLLRGNHRLGLSGTPIENHLGELWSLFEFINPGLLGSHAAFRSGQAHWNAADELSRAVLARAVRPFILRRTKDQVAKDLPEKTELTLHCELDAKERERYDELSEYYRSSLLQRIDADGIGKSKMHILEALLRLRQAACHPGLIDKTKTSMSSAKIDVLMANVAEVVDEGHKALVFSQFTSFLSIVRRAMDEAGIVYEYLDGRTRHREPKIQRFQTDPDCPLFLISLKAGGLGLNLTAADYVFLLDPWWNPAVEAQAIDRVHRIGQKNKVFAYRLIASDTVEEKIVELQDKKRELADAIINADQSLIRTIGREDLEFLLSG